MHSLMCSNSLILFLSSVRMFSFSNSKIFLSSSKMYFEITLANCCHSFCVAILISTKKVTSAKRAPEKKDTAISLINLQLSFVSPYVFITNINERTAIAELIINSLHFFIRIQTRFQLIFIIYPSLSIPT